MRNYCLIPLESKSLGSNYCALAWNGLLRSNERPKDLEAVAELQAILDERKK